MAGMTNAQSLRERRRRQTSWDIHHAALRLVRERGMDGVTVDDISAEAGVSPRTFFNYFPNKESAIAYAPFDIMSDLAAEFVAAGPAPNSVLLRDVISLTIRNLVENPPPRRDELAALFEIGHSSAAVASAILSQFDQFEARLAALVAERTGMMAGEDIPVLIAALALAVLRTGMMNWAKATPVDGDDTPQRHLENAANLVQGLFIPVE